jgi:serine/threonine-protein kinase HipA
LDPDLQLFGGAQYLRDEKVNFGLFLDSSPDRWGKMLMRRREAISAREEKRAEKQLLESDYLLGVYDKQRLGGLRFKRDISGSFLNSESNYSVPPWSSLRELEYACQQIEKDDITSDSQYFKWLDMLMSPGSSLGGARPKAGVLDNKKHLWIAKFPSRNDRKDIGAWEMVVNMLAKNAGINVAEANIKKFSGKYHTYLSKRFDRDENQNRIHFTSAMTMLGYQDGDDGAVGVSYLDIVEFIIQHGSRVNDDLLELWRRIVFSICISNCDDHLRNHGFILTSKGWKLSPAFDINPTISGNGLSLNISENDNSLSLDLAKDVAPYFRVKENIADQIIRQIIRSVKKWREYADKYDISKEEQDTMKRSFLTKL